MWETVLKAAVGSVLAPFLLAFYQRFVAARKDNESLLLFIEQQVRRAYESTDDNGTKFAQIQEDALRYAKEFGIDVSESLINALIEVAVQKVKGSM